VRSLKPFFILLRHVPTADDALGILTPPNAETELLPVESEVFVRIAKVIDSVASATGRDVEISTSPTDRGKATAVSVATRLSCRHTLVEDGRLLNIDQGSISGHSQEQFATSPLYWQWHHFPNRVSFPKGERLTDVASRIDEFISDKCNVALVNVVISHTTPLQVIATRLLGLDLSAVWRFYFAHHHITVIYGATLMAANSLAEPGTWTSQLRE
jgi:broad specificity phosphatase PhoE